MNPADPQADEAQRKLVRNEQIKLAATASNNLAVAFVVTGVIGPAAAAAYQITTPNGRFWIAFVVLWPMMGLLTHLIGRHILKGLLP
jgi:uncharacterized membrane-anchored protein